MKKSLNPPLEVGDRIVCYYMDGETGVPPGTKGTVKSISRDPFEEGDCKIFQIKWDNGSTLGLCSVSDAWKKIEQEKIQEQTRDSSYDFFSKNREFFKNFDWRFLRNYLYKLRESGIINMFESSPLLYCGKEHLDRYYGENPPHQEAFDDLLDMADDAKNKMVNGTLKYMDTHNMDMDIDNINRIIGKLAVKMVYLFINFD